MVELISEHLDATPEISVETVKRKAVKGVVVLTGRTFILSVISFTATALLMVYLEPSQFGVFWIVSAIVNFFTYFSDIGLAAALIQKRQLVAKEDLSTTFIFQQTLVLLLLLVLFFLTPTLAKIYSLSSEGIMLLYALGFSLFLSSLKTIPSVLLERELEFGKLVVPQLIENVVYNSIAVLLAWKGMGIASFTYAVVARGIVGLVIIYLIKPWFPVFLFSKESLKRLLSYGLPYQANTFIALVKDDGMTALLGGILGTTGIGLLGWAQKWAYAPLRFFMDHVLKVTFPAFSRMQDEPDQLARSVTRSIFFICFLVFPTLAGLLVLAPSLVDIIPRYEKWSPALSALTLMGISTVFAPITSTLTNLLNAIGKVKTTFKLMIMWTVITWIFVPVLAYFWGVSGAAAGFALVAPSSIVAIYVVKKHINFSLIDSAAKPAIASIIMGIMLLVVKGVLPTSLLSAFILIIFGVISYTLSIYLLVGSPLISDVKKTLSTLLSR